jgi:hypothetical protein
MRFLSLIHKLTTKNKTNGQVARISSRYYHSQRNYTTICLSLDQPQSSIAVVEMRDERTGSP